MNVPREPRIGYFYLTTFAIFTTFASGMGVCMFNLNTVDDCVAYSNSYVAVFQAMGDHLVAWAMALKNGAFPHGLFGA